MACFIRVEVVVGLACCALVDSVVGLAAGAVSGALVAQTIDKRLSSEALDGKALFVKQRRCTAVSYTLVGSNLACC